MAIIETNWEVQRKDLKLFGTIGLFVFGLLAVGKFADLQALGRYGDRLMSWQLMAVAAGLSLIGANLKVVPARQRKYGYMGVVLFGALAAALGGHVFEVNRWVYVGLTIFFALGAMGSELIRPFYFIALVATFPIGLVVGPVIMAVIFFVVFTPVGLFFKLIGRDTMTRSFDASASTYWVARRPTTDVKRYFRQF